MERLMMIDDGWMMVLVAPRLMKFRIRYYDRVGQSLSANYVMNEYSSICLVAYTELT